MYASGLKNSFFWNFENISDKVCVGVYFSNIGGYKRVISMNDCELIPKAYLEPYYMYKMILFGKTANSFK